MKRAVLFDLDGVLTNGWHTNPDKRVSWSENIHEDLGINVEALEQFFFKGAFIQEVLTGRKGLEEVLAVELPQCGFDGTALQFIDYWMERDSNMKKPLLDIIKKIKETNTVRLFVATNNERVRANHMWEIVGLKHYFEDIFYAGDFGVLKPDSAFFKACEKKIGDLGEEPPLFFDDSPVYVDGACSCGWEGVVFNDIEDCTRHPYIAKLLS